MLVQQFRSASATSCRTLAVAVALTLIWASVNAEPVRLGVMGDSDSDEYRADDNRGGQFASVTFNWVEILQRLRDVDFGPWGAREEPRRTGYAHNWARSGARAADLVHQRGGLAQQVRDGRVDYVIVYIGINDFGGSRYREIYDGTVAGAALEQKVQGVLSDIRAAVEVVLDAGAKVVVTGIVDEGLHPGYHAEYPDPARRQRVSDAIDVINDALEEDAHRDPSLAYSDIAQFWQSLTDRMSSEGELVVGGERIDIMNRGNEPRHAQLDDNAGHPGTVSSGLMANYMFLNSLNTAFDVSIPPLTDQEILCLAAIAPEQNCAGPPPLAPPSPPVLTMVE